MLIDFDQIKEITVSGMSNGTGTMRAKMYVDEQGNKYIPCSIHAGGSIGLHRHGTSDDINFIISGKGEAICDGQKESLSAGVCHICKKGSQHSIINTGNDDLVLFTVVMEK